MAEDKKPKSWWQTLPGIFSGLAALITATTGAFLAANQLGFFENKIPDHGEFKKEIIEKDELFLMNRAVTENDLAGKTYRDLDIMRNTIYARHGRRFNRIDLQEYFNQQPWYKPIYMPEKFPIGLLTGIQKANVEYIALYQTRLK